MVADLANLATPANLVTLTRFLLVPVIALAAAAGERLTAAALLGIAGATDWLDGWLARRLGQVTAFGKVADPTVDRLLIITALVIVYLRAGGLVPLWAVVFLIARDVATLAGGAYLSAKGRRPPVSFTGKVATACLMVALVMLLADVSLVGLRSALVGTWLFYLGLVLAFASGLDYLRSGREALRAGGTQ